MEGAKFKILTSGEKTYFALVCIIPSGMFIFPIDVSFSGLCIQEEVTETQLGAEDAGPGYKFNSKMDNWKRPGVKPMMVFPLLWAHQKNFPPKIYRIFPDL